MGTFKWGITSLRNVNFDRTVLQGVEKVTV